MMNPIRILIADPSTTQSLHLKTFLEERGFEAMIANDGEEALKMITRHRPQLVLVELMLPKQNALQLLKSLGGMNIPAKEHPKVVILSQQANIDNIKECLKWGATDFLLKPLDEEDIVSRLVFHLQPSRSGAKNAQTQASNLYLHLVELVLRQVNQGEKLRETLSKLVQMSAMTLKSVRASVVKCNPNRVGIVKASSDDKEGIEWKLDLKKYPEILFVSNTEKPLVIENLDNDPTLNQIKKYFTSITFNSMIVIPVYTSPLHFYGVLTVRMPSDRSHILDEELQFCQILAQCIGLTLRLSHNSASLKTA